MKTRLLTVSLVLAVAGPVRAVGFNAGVNQAYGTDDYSGTNVYAAVGAGGISFSPEWRRYLVTGPGLNFNNVPVQDRLSSNGSYNTLQARLGYDMRYFGIGATAGRTLKHNDYESTFGGADLAVTLSPLGDTGIRRIGGPGRGGAPVGKGVARIDFGGGALVTGHKETLASGESKLTQTEVHGFAGVSVMGLLFSVRGAKFQYSDNPKDRATLPSPRWTPITGQTSYTAGGYADTSWHVRGELTMFPMVAPFGGYTYTSFKERQVSGVVSKPGDTRSVIVGLRVGLELVAVEGSYEHKAVTGAAKEENYVQVGASLRL